MPETPEYSTTVTLRLQGKAYSEDAMRNRWGEVERTIMKVFGPSNYEIMLKPEWELKMVEDTTEQPEIN